LIHPEIHSVTVRALSLFDMQELFSSKRVYYFKKSLKKNLKYYQNNVQKIHERFLKINGIDML
jgi:hypothetical protein